MTTLHVSSWFLCANYNAIMSLNMAKRGDMICRGFFCALGIKPGGCLSPGCNVCPSQMEGQACPCHGLPAYDCPREALRACVLFSSSAVTPLPVLWLGQTRLHCVWNLWKDCLGWLWAQRTPTDLVGQHCVGWYREEDAFCPLDFWLSPREDSFEALNRSMACVSDPVGGFYLQVPLWVTGTSVCGLWAQPCFPGPMQVSFRKYRVPSHIVNNFKTLLLCTMCNAPYILTRGDQASDTCSLGRKSHTSVWSTYPAPQDLATGCMEPGISASLLPSYSSPEWLPSFLLLFPLMSCATLGQMSRLKESTCWSKDQIPIRVFAAN